MPQSKLWKWVLYNWRRCVFELSHRITFKKINSSGFVYVQYAFGILAGFVDSSHIKHIHMNNLIVFGLLHITRMVMKWNKTTRKNKNIGIEKQEREREALQDPIRHHVYMNRMNASQCTLHLLYMSYNKEQCPCHKV